MTAFPPLAVFVVAATAFAAAGTTAAYRSLSEDEKAVLRYKVLGLEYVSVFTHARDKQVMVYVNMVDQFVFPSAKVEWGDAVKGAQDYINWGRKLSVRECIARAAAVRGTLEMTGNALDPQGLKLVDAGFFTYDTASNAYRPVRSPNDFMEYIPEINSQNARRFSPETKYRLKNHQHKINELVGFPAVKL